MADKDDVSPGLYLTFGLTVDFGYEWAGCVQISKATLLRICRDRFWYAMS